MRGIKSCVRGEPLTYRLKVGGILVGRGVQLQHELAQRLHNVRAGGGLLGAVGSLWRRRWPPIDGFAARYAGRRGLCRLRLGLRNCGWSWRGGWLLLCRWRCIRGRPAAVAAHDNRCMQISFNLEHTSQAGAYDSCVKRHAL